MKGITGEYTSEADRIQEIEFFILLRSCWGYVLLKLVFEVNFYIMSYQIWTIKNGLDEYSHLTHNLILFM